MATEPPSAVPVQHHHSVVLFAHRHTQSAETVNFPLPSAPPLWYTLAARKKRRNAMKKTPMLLALAAACAFHSFALDTRHVEIKSTNDIAILKSIPEWRRGVDTNGITITVCVGMAEYRRGCADYPLSRELTFDADGRLARVSPITVIPCWNTGEVESLDVLRRRLFPSADERNADEAEQRKQKAELLKIQEELRARRDARKAIQQGRSRCTPGQPTAPRPSAKPSVDGK